MKNKKNTIIIIAISIFVLILVASLLMILSNKNKGKEIHYRAQLKNNTVIKYLSSNNIIKVIFEDNKSNVYYNNKKVGVVKIKEAQDKIVEKYYDSGIEEYIYKRIIYKNNDLIKYSELYDHNDKLLNTMHFENNKVKKIIYNNSFKVDEYKTEEKKLLKYTYKKDVLYSKCQYDEKNIYITFCEIYDKQGNVMTTTKHEINEYGFETNRTIEDKLEKMTDTISYEMKKGKINSVYKSPDTKKTEIILSIYDHSLFGSKILYNTPYLYNRYYYHIEKIDNTFYYYDDTNTNNVEVEIDSKGYTKSFGLNLEERTEYIDLYQGVKFKSYEDVIGYYKSSEENIYNIAGYSYEYKEFIKDAHVKSIYRSGKVKYYDWFTEKEISEEEYNIMLEELNAESN